MNIDEVGERVHLQMKPLVEATGLSFKNWNSYPPDVKDLMFTAIRVFMSNPAFTAQEGYDAINTGKGPYVAWESLDVVGKMFTRRCRAEALREL